MFSWDDLGGVNTFKTLKLRDRWGDVDESWCVYAISLWTQLLGSSIFNFGSCATRVPGQPELSSVVRDDPERAPGVFI